MRSPYRQAFNGHRIESRILILFLALAISLFALATLASEVKEGDTFAFDSWILKSLRNVSDPSTPIGPQWLKAAMIDITALGSVTVLTLLTHPIHEGVAPGVGHPSSCSAA
jgi:undecaprenyl-diphosphatase